MSSRASGPSRWSRGVSTWAAIQSAWRRAAMRRVARTSRTAVGLGPTHTRSRSPAAPGAPFACRPGVADAAFRHVAGHLRVHPLGGAAERQLPQRDEIALAEELLD